MMQGISMDSQTDCKNFMELGDGENGRKVWKWVINFLILSKKELEIGLKQCIQIC